MHPRLPASVALTPLARAAITPPICSSLAPHSLPWPQKLELKASEIASPEEQNPENPNYDPFDGDEAACRELAPDNKDGTPPSCRANDGGAKRRLLVAVMKSGEVARLAGPINLGSVCGGRRGMSPARPAWSLGCSGCDPGLGGDPARKAQLTRCTGGTQRMETAGQGCPHACL